MKTVRYVVVIGVLAAMIIVSGCVTPPADIKNGISELNDQLPKYIDEMETALGDEVEPTLKEKGSLLADLVRAIYEWSSGDATDE